MEAGNPEELGAVSRPVVLPWGRCRAHGFLLSVSWKGDYTGEWIWTGVTSVFCNSEDGLFFFLKK